MTIAQIYNRDSTNLIGNLLHFAFMLFLFACVVIQVNILYVFVRCLASFTLELFLEDFSLNSLGKTV